MSVNVYHTCFSVCASISSACGFYQQECSNVKVRERKRETFRGQGKLLEIPGMPAFPRMSRAVVQTQLCC